jgi:predicted protein tyrosine phosphatase
MEEQLKNIIVLSRKWAKQFKCDKPWAAISVSTQPGDFPELSAENRLGLLRLCFWDISKPSLRQLEAEDPKLFTREQGREILDFVDEHWDKIDTLLVHCEAGMSRSPAIASAIISIKYGEGADAEWFKTYHLLNRFVYKLITEEYHGVDSKAAHIAERLLQKGKENDMLSLLSEIIDA